MALNILSQCFCPQNYRQPIGHKSLCSSVILHNHRQHYHLQGFILLCWNVGWFSPEVPSFLCTKGSLFTAGSPSAPVPIPVRLPVPRPPTRKNEAARSLIITHVLDFNYIKDISYLKRSLLIILQCLFNFVENPNY